MVLLDSKKSRIAEVLDELIEQQRRANAPVNFQAVAAKYPDLMPDLAIRFAAIQAREINSTTSTQARGPSAASLLGTIFTEMENLEPLDQGAQGLVYKAWHRPTRRDVAIKVLANGPASTTEQRRRFQQEVELVARLRHPNIVSIYDSGEALGYSYIVMEYIQGCRIDDHVCVDQLSVRQIVSLFCTICDAVNFAHQHAVLHRDLKPSNILVDMDGQPHILDFGLAKDTEPNIDHSLISLTGQVVGTLPYLSPDQVKGEPSSIQTDVYALGVILFELLTGEYPYPIDDNRYRSLSNIVTREPVSPRKILSAQRSSSIQPGDINGDLERIILKALAKEPQRRYVSASALADDLRCYLAGDAVLARSASRIYVLRKTVKKFRALFIAFFVCIVVLAGALVAVTAAWRQSDRNAKTAMAGLEMGSLLKIGSVERDAGRLDDAARLFENVVAIARTTNADDPTIQRQLCKAHHRLADLCFEKKDLECAASHIEKSYGIAHGMSNAQPGDPLNQTQLAAVLVIKGRLLCNREQYQEALGFFQEACAMQERLLATQPDNPSLNGDLAFSLGWLGRCARKLNLIDDATASYTRAHNIAHKLSQDEPESLSRGLDLLRAESKMAILYLSLQSADHKAKAAEWLTIAESHLAQLKVHPKAAQSMLTIEQLNYEIVSNRQILNRG